MFFSSPSRRAAVRAETHALLALALPIMIAQLAYTATGFVDTVMSGRLGADALAAVSIGSAIMITVYITLSGVVTALNPLVAHQIGAGQHAQVGGQVRQGLWTALACGLLGTGVMLAAGEWVARGMQLEPAVAQAAQGYLIGAALGMPAALVYRALHAYSSAVGQARPIMVISLVALALNIPLNYILMYGKLGLPALGGAGSGWATGLVFWFSCLALAGWVRWRPAYQRYAVWQRWDWPHGAAQRAILKLGVPIALSYFVEVSAFTSVALLIAKLGAKTVASHQVVINFTSLLYMIPQSLGAALSVRVGHAVGAGNYVAARFNSQIGLWLGCAVALLASLTVFGLRDSIAGMYSTDASVVAMAASLLAFAAVFQLADAMQTIASGALRGYKLTTVPMIIHTVSFWGIGLGLGIWLGLSEGPLPGGWQRPLGAYGFWAALTLSILLAAILLLALLRHESRRHLPCPRPKA